MTNSGRIGPVHVPLYLQHCHNYAPYFS